MHRNHDAGLVKTSFTRAWYRRPVQFASLRTSIMIPQTPSQKLQAILEMMLETDRTTLIVIVMITAVVIYNVRNFLANPAMATFISPMIVVLSVAVYQVLILAEFTIPNVFSNWLVSTVVATSAGAGIGIVITAIVGQIFETMARLRRRNDMPEFQDPGPAQRPDAAAR
jgi:hypothetical protein